LKRGGFVVDRTAGSDHLLVDPNVPEWAVTVPYGTKTLKLGTLRSILRQAGLTVEAFRRLL